MGSPSASTGGGRTDAGPNRTTATKIGVGNINEKGKLTGQYRSDNPTAFRNRGAEKIKKGVKGPVALQAAVGLFSGAFQAGSKASRDFFTDKVLGSKNYKNVSKQEFLSYSPEKQDMMFGSYMDKRTSGETDAYGNKIVTGDGGGAIASTGQVVQAPKVEAAPTEAEVSQVTTAEATPEEDILLRKRRTKRRGRSPTILTGVTGVTGGLTLGKPSLLGRA